MHDDRVVASQHDVVAETLHRRLIFPAATHEDGGRGRGRNVVSIEWAEHPMKDGRDRRAPQGRGLHAAGELAAHQGVGKRSLVEALDGEGAINAGQTATPAPIPLDAGRPQLGVGKHSLVEQITAGGPSTAARLHQAGSSESAQASLPARAAGADRPHNPRATDVAHTSLEELIATLGEGEALGGREAGLAQRVGADPSVVRVHRGQAASQAAAQHRAMAFTAGNHIVMGSGAPAAGTPEGDELLVHELAHTAQQLDAARDPTQRKKPIGGEDQGAEHDADRAASAGLPPSAHSALFTADVMRTGLQIQRSPWPQQTPKDVASRSLTEKAALVRRSATNRDEGWSRVVVDVFEQTAPAARIALQRQLDMETIVKAMPDFEATRLGTLGPLAAGQAALNKKRAAYIQQVIHDFGGRAEVLVLFAFRGVYDDDAYTIFAELANRRTLHKLLAMPEVAKQIKARGLRTDGFAEPGTGALEATGGVLGGLGAGLKRVVKDDRPDKYQWQKSQLPPEYEAALWQMELAELESGMTVKNTVIGAIDEVTFGVPHGIVDLGRSTAGAIGDMAHGDYHAAGEQLAGASVVVLTHLGVKAWKVVQSTRPRAPSPGDRTEPVDNTPGVKRPSGPGQFVIPSFEGPITAQEARLGAIFDLNPEAQAAMGRLIARIGPGGIEKVAEHVQANSRAALFIAEHGEPGVYALLEANGDAAVAATKLPKRQLAAGTASTLEGPQSPAAARVRAPGNHPELIKELDSKAKIDPKYTKDPRFDSLAADPDHNGKSTPNSLQEAMAGLEAESRGLLKGPIERGPKGIEFYDADGHPWDVKKPPSPTPGAGWRFSLKRTVASIQEQLQETLANKVTGIQEPIRVLLDSSYMNPADHAALWAELDARLSAEELSRIVELNTIPLRAVR